MRLFMCKLITKVGSILRECGLPWTTPRMRYVRLYCALRHLEGRACATRRDVANVVAVIVEDWYNVCCGNEGSPHMMQSLAQLELDMLTNIRLSPFCRSRVVLQ
jgi:hypothetical protein